MMRRQIASNVSKWTSGTRINRRPFRISFTPLVASCRTSSMHSLDRSFVAAATSTSMTTVTRFGRSDSADNTAVTGENKHMDWLSVTFEKLQSDTVKSAARSFLFPTIGGDQQAQGDKEQSSFDKDYGLVEILNRLSKNPQLGEALVKELYELAASVETEKAHQWRPNRDHFMMVLQAWRDYDPPSAKRTQALVEWMGSKDDSRICDIDIYNFVLATWAEKGNAERAQAFLEKMGRQKQLTLNKESFLHVLDAWSVSKSPMAPKRAESILSWMYIRKIEPDNRCLLRTIECWASKARTDESLQKIESILAQMKRKSRKMWQGDLNDRDGYSPSLVAQATLKILDAYQNIGNAHKSEEILLDYVDEFRLDETATIPPPTRAMCLSVLTTWSKSKSSRRAIRAEKLFQMMERQDDVFPRPGVEELTAVLHAFATSKQPNSAQRAEELIRRMEDLDEEKGKIETNLMAWTCILDAWAYMNIANDRNVKNKTTEVHVEAERIHDEILSRGMIPDRLVYGGLITAWGRSKNDSDSIFKVEKYFEKIKDLEGDSVTVVEYTATMQAYAKYLANHNGENSRMCVARVESLLEEMIEAKIKPTGLTFAAALKCVAASNISDRSKKAEMILDLMQSEGIEMTTYIHGLANKCFVQQKANDVDGKPILGTSSSSTGSKSSSSSVAFETQVCVIGAGVVGLAVARAISASGYEVLLIDKAANVGSETSSRNSEVLHAGLYYPPGTFKAKFCVEGQRMIYKYCQEREIQHKKCGKLVVATQPGQFDNEITKLFKQAQANGVSDCKLISSIDVSAMEPDIKCVDGALFSPSTGVVDSHSLMLHLLADAENNGGTTLVLNTKVTDAYIDSMESNSGHLQLRFDDGTWISCSAVVNCAGLWADMVARLIHQTNPTDWQPPRHYFALGHYMKLQDTQSPMFNHLIYPIPEQGGLGVHATIDWAGGSNAVKFGPNVEWVDAALTDPSKISLRPHIDNNQKLSNEFCRAIQTYWPGLPSGSHLVPDYSGIRPKLSHPAANDGSLPPSFQDFVIADQNTHGIPGLVHLLGIESPGLTSSMALGNYVAQLIDSHLSFSSSSSQVGRNRLL